MITLPINLIKNTGGSFYNINKIYLFKDYNTDEVYFILMECEVENKSVIPNLDELPAFIKDAIIKKVTLGDSTFSSYI